MKKPESGFLDGAIRVSISELKMSGWWNYPIDRICKMRTPALHYEKTERRELQRMKGGVYGIRVRKSRRRNQLFRKWLPENLRSDYDTQELVRYWVVRLDGDDEHSW